MTGVPLLSVKGIQKYMNGPTGRPFMMAATAPWCGHCHNLYPLMVDISKHTDVTNGKYAVVTFNADKHSKELNGLNGGGDLLGYNEIGIPLVKSISGFPTIIMFDGKGGAAVYNGGRNVASMTSAMNSFLGGH